MSKSRFKGWNIKDMEVKQTTFTCRDKKCGIGCQVNRVTTEDGEAVFFGDRCERYTTGKSVKPSEIETLVDKRNEELMRTRPHIEGRQTVGIARASLNLGGMGTFAINLFESLGYNVVISDETNDRIKKAGIETSKSSFCLPIKVAYGHTLNLVDKGVDYIWLPSYQSMPNTAFKKTHVCPWVQGLPDSARVALEGRLDRTQLLAPRLHLREEKSEAFFSEIEEMFRNEIRSDIYPAELRQKVQIALERQRTVEAKLKKEIGERFLADAQERKDGKEYFILISRPYNGCDPGMTFRLSNILAKYNIEALPMDMLPDLDSVVQSPEFRDKHPNMYYVYGQKILAIAHLLQDEERFGNIFPVYCTSFNCGPDAFIIPFFDNDLQGKSCLYLSFDEQSGEAHTVTRVEAFIDSIQGIRRLKKAPKKRNRTFPVKFDVNNKEHTKRTVILTPMDHGGAHALKALLQTSGIKAKVMQQRTREELNPGLELSREDQCFPCAETFATLLKAIKEDGPGNIAMFQGGAEGPCRYGLYDYYQPMKLCELAEKIGDPRIAEIPFHTLNAETGYAVEGMPPVMRAAYSGSAYAAIRTIDHLKKARNIVRMRELAEGDADCAYSDCLEELCSTIRSMPYFSDRSKDIRFRDFQRAIGSIISVARKSGRRFGRIPIDESKPLMKIIGDGEIFVRLHPPSNKFIESYFREHHNQLVEIAPLSYWLDATDYFYLGELRQNRDTKKMRAVKIKMLFKYLVGLAIDEPFNKINGFHHAGDVTEIINAGAEILRCGLKGE
ncbi:hypothetical protein GF371_00330, partial [Candidatus Woesearchaeota archaeon]|nr:hypothetical protein [Candidatus Woesearchaeota archaeon]